MFNQINLSSIYIMKINYIILGVAIILIILMMCSNKTEGFREGWNREPKIDLTDNCIAYKTGTCEKHGRENLEDTFLKIARSKNELE